MEKIVLKPASVFHYFEEICKVPRPSKKEEMIIAYLMNFAKGQGLEAKKDEAGNIAKKKVDENSDVDPEVLMANAYAKSLVSIHNKRVRKE